MAKLRVVVLLVLLLQVVNVSAQIVTSKKEAIKKGIYNSNTHTTKAVVKATAEPTKEPAKTIQSKASNGSKVVTAPKAKTATKASKTALINEAPDTDLIFPSFTNYLGTQMINNAMSFIGTRYRGGGTTTAGMDCSGMVTAVLDIFDIKMPRSSHEMAKVGEKLDPKDVQAGDLIFFRTNGRSVINHVGMVVEIIGDEIKFIHSSTNKGVIISSTKEPYYKRTFAQVNRIEQKN